MATSAPFTVELLTADYHDDCSELLPTVVCIRKDALIVPFLSNNILEFLGDDLAVDKLNDIHQHLWMAGRPRPPRHLRQQATLSRSINLCEEMGLHLVWKANFIYIKPMPKYLLAVSFWNKYLLSKPFDDLRTSIERAKLAACARGFLLSYCYLVRYESDFHLAKDAGLLPDEIGWKQWRTWALQVVQGCPHDSINERFRHGELRLSRLNMIYRWHKGFLLHGYTIVGAPSSYSEFLKEKFYTLFIGLGFFVVILTAMQVGLATDRLHESLSFQAVSWGFTVVTIVASSVALVAIVGVFLVAFAINLVRTKHMEGGG